MIGTSSLPGDTLIACHVFPVVQLPAWSLPVRALCPGGSSEAKRLSVGSLTRAVSLPERDSLNREHFASATKPFSNSYCSLNEERGVEEEEEVGNSNSDSSGKYDSTSSPEEEMAPAGSRPETKEDNFGARKSQRSHNSFLPNDTELDEDEEDDDSDGGGNLHRYHEDSSFVLHGNSDWPVSNSTVNHHTTSNTGCMDRQWAVEGPRVSNGARNDTRNHMAGTDSIAWGDEGSTLASEIQRQWLLSNRPPDELTSLQHQSQCHCLFQVSRSGTADSDMSRCLHRHSPEGFFSSNGHHAAEELSDSSCNSSDGVTVNFCSMYHRSNNPATPQEDLISSPAVDPPTGAGSSSSKGSVFLNLRPVPETPAEDLRGLQAPPTTDDTRWSPQGLDSNCNLYSNLDSPAPPGLSSSLEVSDLTACLQGRDTLAAMGTNQKYYKLVTCDLASSQSPSPAWSSLTGTTGCCPVDGQTRSKSFPPSNKEKEDHQMEMTFSSALCIAGFDSPEFQNNDYQVASTSAGKKHTDGVHGLSHRPSHAQRSPRSSRCQGTSTASTQPSVLLDQGRCDIEAAQRGACALDNGAVVRYSKAQRPTSLPIQPFVLVPEDKPPVQHLGCLLDQYINRKGSKSANSQPGFKFQGKRSQAFTNLHLSPMGSPCPIFLEAPSSSDTCSTCTPSPAYFGRRPTCGQSSRSQGCPSPCVSKCGLDSTRTSPYPGSLRVPDRTSPDEYHANTLWNPISVPNQYNLIRNPSYQGLIDLSPEQNHAANNKHGSPAQSETQTSYHAVFTHTPPTLPLTAPDACHPDLHASLSLSLPATSRPERTLQLPRVQTGAPAADAGFFHSSFTAALSSVAPLSSLSSLLLSSLAASGLQQDQDPENCAWKKKPSQGQHGEALTMSDRPPMEFCLSPDTSYESMSISHLQRRGLLRAVSRAVDLIMAHFGSSRDPEEKMRLGNSSCSPTVGGLVLEHLCPSIQNILEDGLRDHKLDLIIGQRRNHSWSVVEVSTRIGPSTRVLQSLASKIRQCPQLTTHCMRLRAFIMGLLNLRALEFWLSHLQSLTDVVTTYYHSWGFLSMSLGQCHVQPMFQELLLLLQPLSVLPFDLNLLLEPRLLSNAQLFCPPTPCSALLATSWPLLQAHRKGNNARQIETSHRVAPPHHHQPLCSPDIRSHNTDCVGTEADGTSPSAFVPEWRPTEPDLLEAALEVHDCGESNADDWSQISMDSRPEERRGRERDDSDSPADVSARAQAESPCQGWLRWAKLFGAAETPTRTEALSQSHNGAQARRCKRPSQWLHLDRSQLGMLAQSIRSMKL